MAENISVINSTSFKPSFWQRQFSNVLTPHQVIFDVVFGILMPVLCFLLDPGIIRGNGGAGVINPPLAKYSLLVYGLSALAIPTLGFWLLFQRRIKTWGGLIAGVLLVAAACSFVIGLIILPLSIMALIIVIGLLGFTPLVTSFVYIRNTVRAFHRAEVYMTRTRVMGSLLSAALLVILVPVTAHWTVSQIATSSIQEILRNDPASIDGAVNRIKYLKWCVNLDPVMLAYEREGDPIRKERLARAYNQITGEDIEHRLRILRD